MAQPDDFVVVFDTATTILFFFFTCVWATGTATGITTGAAVAGTGAGRVAGGSVTTAGAGATINGATVTTGAAVVGAGRTGGNETTGATGNVTSGVSGATGAAPCATLVPVGQPMAAIRPSIAVVDAPAVKILALYAGLRRFGACERNASSRAAAPLGSNGSIIVATATMAAVVVAATVATATVVVDRIARRRLIVGVDRCRHHAVQQVGVELDLDGAGLELDFDVVRVLRFRTR